MSTESQAEVQGGQPPDAAEAKAIEPAADAEPVDAVPLWQQISGLTRENEPRLNPCARRAAIRKLIAAVERLIRGALRDQPPAPLGPTGCGPLQPVREALSEPRASASGLTAPLRSRLGDAASQPVAPGEAEPLEQLLIDELAAADAEVPAGERTFLWDPLPEICAHLGLARNKLTQLCRELTGLSAHELVDRIRAEKVLARLREDLKSQVQRWFWRTCTCDDVKYSVAECDRHSDIEDTVARLLGVLKQRRNRPDFHRTEWAIAHGFPNYPRFFRACLLLHGKTPTHLEAEIVEELIKEIREEFRAEDEALRAERLRLWVICLRERKRTEEQIAAFCAEQRPGKIPPQLPAGFHPPEPPPEKTGA